ncbi:hypothetical protein DFH94DRAFT_768506 [Russula ochroleuca]|uniref:Fungal STAND N-terminal Goodbye domain-containing protein n=1 Tax=Russula ochroleuca TaxID=152965 RepID=A0A9P5MR68_9AGAM|nr:hypothetical protein DFH94DRAFT_768506 [Russula ochroleuca]
MSQSHLALSSSKSKSKFQPIINNALKAYQKRTKVDLLAHPLASQLQACDSSSDIIALLLQRVQGPDQSRNGDDRWTKWLYPTINVLFAFSATLGADVGMAAKDVLASQDTIVDIFGRIEMFFQRLETYTKARPTTEMMDITIQIMVEVLSILGIAMKEIKQGRISE